MRRSVRFLALSATATAVAALAAAPGAQAQPSVSFLWSPAAPHAGETVSFASTSTDFTSPITGFAWDLAGSGDFREAGPVASTTFATAGSHVVGLRVIAADGSSAVATQTIEVSAPTLREILPFPVVSIAGRRVATGVKLWLLSVEAPPGVRIEVECRGRGCPVKVQSLVVKSTAVESVTVSFRRFERFLRAGVVLVIRVSKVGEIGKYTRFLVRHGRAPKREDSCLEPAGRTVGCPVAEA
jgi:PKD repeat protein